MQDPRRGGTVVNFCRGRVASMYGTHIANNAFPCYDIKAGVGLNIGDISHLRMNAQDIFDVRVLTG